MTEKPDTETAALDALRQIHADMVICRSGGDEWASEWLGEQWASFPLELRAAAGDTDAAEELATSQGPRCGNNPNSRPTPGDQKVIDEFQAHLARRAAETPNPA